MIVETMSYGEMIKEIEKDFPILYRKTNYIVEELEKTKEAKRNKPILKVDLYTSKYKNKWIYSIEFSKKNTMRAFILYYETSVGVNAIQVLDGPYLIYTSHCLKRYRERLNLPDMDVKELLKNLISNISLIKPVIVENIDIGIKAVYCVTPIGMILGTYYNLEGYCKMNTFISNDMLKNEQLDISNNANLIITRYLEEIK